MDFNKHNFLNVLHRTNLVNAKFKEWFSVKFPDFPIANFIDAEIEKQYPTWQKFLFDTYKVRLKIGGTKMEPLISAEVAEVFEGDKPAKDWLYTKVESKYYIIHKKPLSLKTKKELMYLLLKEVLLFLQVEEHDNNEPDDIHRRIN